MQTLKDIYALPYKYDPKTLPESAGLYFLVKANCLLYIGQTSNLKHRVSVHKTILQSHKPKIYYKETQSTYEERLALEKRYITRFLPVYNITISDYERAETKYRVNIKHKGYKLSYPIITDDLTGSLAAIKQQLGDGAVIIAEVYQDEAYFNFKTHHNL